MQKNLKSRVNFEREQKQSYTLIIKLVILLKEKRERQVLVEAGREYQREVALGAKEERLYSRGLRERNEKVCWMIVAGGAKWWEG